MKNNTKNQIKSVDAFDDEASLWNLVGDKGLRLLQQIADTECLIEKRDRPFSLILAGKNSTSLYGICFLRSLAMQISHVSAQMLYIRDGLVEFFTPTDADRGYVIEDIEHLSLGIQPKLIQILQSGEFNQYDCSQKCVVTYPVFGIIILASKDIKQVNPIITKTVDYIITIEDITKEQIKQIIKMRLRWANIGYENEKVIDLLATGNSLRTIVSVLKLAIIVMLSANRSYLTEQDILKARECL